MIRKIERIASDLYINELQTLFGLYRNEIFYMAGSVIEGYGNEYSDIDLFILTNNRIEQLGFDDEVNIDSLSYKSTNSVILNNKRFDIEVLNLDNFILKIDKINNFTFKRSNNVFNIMWFNYVDIIHKFITGVSIFGEKKHREVEKMIDKTKFYKVVSAMHLLKADGYMEDVKGTYQINDSSTLYYVCHFMLHCLLKSYLAMRGYTNTNPKWIIHALSNFQDEKDRYILSKYIEIIEYPYKLCGGKELYRNYTYKVMELYHLINSYVQEWLDYEE